MQLRPFLGFCLSLFAASYLFAADYRVEALDEGPPADELSAEIAGQLAETGIRVIRGTSTAYCDIWLLKQWEVAPGFEPTPEVNYPFRPGQLIGVARFARRGADFRDQDIDSGVYTLRYAQQPVDGAHVGTSPTRDFLLLVRADADEEAGVVDQEDLNYLSAEAAQSTHPCLLCLQRVQNADAEFPSMRHYDEFDWWIVGFKGTVKAGDATKQLTVELVVEGTAIE